ncbi:MAG: hypothetical protein ACKVW3_01080 [Phycisphaerales bacterium]
MLKHALVTTLILIPALSGCEEAPAPAPKTTAPAATPAPKVAEPVKETAGKAATEIKEGAGKAVEAVKEGAGKAVEEGKKAVAALSADISAAAEGYISSLTSASGSMSKMTDTLSTTTGLPGLKGTLGKIGDYAKQLSGQNPEIVTKIKEQFGGALGPALKGFKDQVDRLTKDSSLGKIVGDSLKSVKLFE